MHLVTYNQDEKVRKGTLQRVSAVLYGAYRSCNPSETLRRASQVIGRGDLRHRDILLGNLTEAEAQSILEHIEHAVPDLRGTIIARVTEMLKS